jgi:hypothetical protein
LVLVFRLTLVFVPKDLLVLLGFLVLTYGSELERLLFGVLEAERLYSELERRCCEGRLWYDLGFLYFISVRELFTAWLLLSCPVTAPLLLATAFLLVLSVGLFILLDVPAAAVVAAPAPDPLTVRPLPRLFTTVSPDFLPLPRSTVVDPPLERGTVVPPEVLFLGP